MITYHVARIEGCGRDKMLTRNSDAKVEHEKYISTLDYSKIDLEEDYILTLKDFEGYIEWINMDHDD